MKKLLTLSFLIFTCSVYSGDTKRTDQVAKRCPTLPPPGLSNSRDIEVRDELNRLEELWNKARKRRLDQSICETQPAPLPEHQKLCNSDDDSSYNSDDDSSQDCSDEQINQIWESVKASMKNPLSPPNSLNASNKQINKKGSSKFKSRLLSVVYTFEKCCRVHQENNCSSNCG